MPDRQVRSEVFDATLLRVDKSTSRASFVAEGVSYITALTSPARCEPGSVGVLRFFEERGASFDAYPDQRLRRAPTRDDPHGSHWGWVIEGHSFTVRAGTVPGLAGAVVRDRCTPLQVPIPPEFSLWCRALDVQPLDLLRAFIADLCRIQDSRRCPREDGYCSSGTDERFMACEYFRRVYPWLKLRTAADPQS